MALRKFMELKERSGMSLEMAAKGVISWSKGTDMAVNATQELTPHKPDMNDIQTLHEMINEQSELIDKQNDLLKMVVGKLVELEGRQKEPGRAIYPKGVATHERHRIATTAT
ncbi:hypothetical protein GCM10020331_010490 [Ectobacillus funiculus]